MLSKLSVFVQDTPLRRIALVPQVPKEPNLELPLIIKIKDSSTEAIALEYTRDSIFDASEWNKLQSAYGYLGNVAFGPSEAFIVVVLGYEAIAKLSYPPFDNSYINNSELQRTSNTYRITQVGFISLNNNVYDIDPDINPNFVPAGHSWHSAEYFENPEELENPNYPYLSDDNSEEYVGLASSFKKKNSGSKANPTLESKLSFTKTDSLNEDPESIIFPYDTMKKLLSTQYFYFSHGIDLTRSFQTRMPQKNNPPESLLSKLYPCDPDFLWNYSLLTCQLQYLEQIGSRDSTEARSLFRLGLITPVIQGYIEPFFHTFGLKAAAIISRVCWKRAGTRFHSRGLDDEGYVANLVETELILSSDKYHFGFVTIRGSIPAFWTQEGNQLLGHRIQLTRGSDATQPATNRHFEWMQRRYGDIKMINLLGEKEGSAEAVLSDRFRTLVDNSPKSLSVSLISFDFHVQCKKNQYEPAHELIRRLKPELHKGSYFLWDHKSATLVSHQKNIFRINCLDCLDRTNVIQGLVLSQIVDDIQDKLGIDPLVSSYHEPSDPGSSSFKSQLALSVSNNGDTISKIYAGTGALQSGVAVGGKASFVNRLQDASKSVSRLYLHHFHDKTKQEAIDHLVGRSLTFPKVLLFCYAPPLPSTRPSHLLSTNLMNTENLVKLSKESIVIHCGTYNVNGRIPSGKSLTPWLQPLQGSKMADIYVLAFEEIVELTPSQILAADLERALQWESLLLRDLNILSEEFEDPAGYVLLTSEQLVGICMFIFVKRDLLPSISQVRRCIKKTGLRGIAGNKGATAIRFRLENKTFCFIACHFASGQTKFEERNKDFYTIHSGLRFPTFNGPNNHDVVIYMGDFNYRIDMTNEQVRQYANRGQLSLLLEKDQLTEARQRGWIFSEFSEGAISFPPTYKYDIGTEDYDTSEKQRIPAWTDRVLYKGSKVTQLYYSLAPLYESDHRPVVAGFRVSFHDTNSEKESRNEKPMPRETTAKKIPLFCPPRPGNQTVPENKKPSTGPLLGSITLKSNSPEPSWWDIPLINLLPDQQGNKPTDSYNESELLSKLDKTWSPQFDSNPFRQPGLDDALSRTRSKPQIPPRPSAPPTHLMD